MRPSIVISALVAVLVGFGGSVAIVLAAAKAVGASPAETSSWVAALCLATALSSGYLSIRHRLPIVGAWSTPGAALIATTSGIDLAQAVGAFILAAVLVLLTAAFRPINDLIARIPTAIASAMLAGVLFGFVVAVFEQLSLAPGFVLPLLLLFAVLRLISAAWAVLITLVCGIVLASAFGMTAPFGELSLTRFVWIAPVFDPAVLIGLGLPLYLVTMASQNLPGFAVLRASGYPVPSRSILGVTGGLSLLTAGLGAHASNLAAITAAICTGPEAHPDKDKRWLCGPVYAVGYLLLTAFGASVVALFASFPDALIVTVAGIALAGPLVGALGAALAEEEQRFAAVATFLVTASGFAAFGVGAAFWGLAAGLILLGLETVVRRGIR